MTTNPHRVTLTLEEGRVESVRGICDDVTADCHYVCTDECEAWDLPLVRGEDGTVWHTYVDDDTEAEVRHLMWHRDACTITEWLDMDEWPSESMLGELELTLPAEIKVDPSDGTCTWRPHTEPAVTSIPARLLSGEHVGREVVLPDGEVRGSLVAAQVQIVLSMTPLGLIHARNLAPDDVVTLVAEEADHG